MVTGGPFGTKVVATVTAGTFVGPKINASLAEDVAAGDGLTVLADGTFSLDVRLSRRTDDGADIHVTYVGYGTRNDDGTARIRTAPRFETGDERYAWLNGSSVSLSAPGRPTASSTRSTPSDRADRTRPVCRASALVDVTLSSSPRSRDGRTMEVRATGRFDDE